MAQLGQEELDLVVAEAPKLGAEDVGDADMVRIASASARLATGGHLTSRRRDRTRDMPRKGRDPD
jgi:hypothetical protein